MYQECTKSIKQFKSKLDKLDIGKLETTQLLKSEKNY